MSTDNAKSPADLHVETVRTAITKAATDPAGALTVELFKALAALKQRPETVGQYLALLSELVEADKKVLRRTVIEKSVGEYLPKGRDGTQDTTPDELRDGIEPWPDEVDGAALADELAVLVQRHCVLPAGGADALVLWMLAAYAIDSFRVFPKLLLYSPQKRCGKTTTLEVLAALLPRPLVGSNVTPSVIFRAIETWRVSVLLDEVDTFIHGHDELRGIVNSGHTRASAYVWRVEGDTVREPVRYSTWAPMVVAMIGSPPGTILDRSVTIALERKTKADTVSRLPRTLVEDSAELRQRCQRWADDEGTHLAHADPRMPETGNDRALDNWSALVAVADRLGDDWPARARTAFRTIAASVIDDGDDLSIELLRDLRTILADEPTRTTLRSQLLVDLLNDMPERPWPTVSHGKELSAHRLARLLRPYRIVSGSRREPGSKATAKGYGRDDIAQAIARYLPPEPPPETGTPAQASNHAALSVFESGTDGQVVPDTKSLRASLHAGCAGVPVPKGGAAPATPETRPVPTSEVL